MLVVDQLVLRSVSSYIDVPLTEPRVLVVEGALLFFLYISSSCGKCCCLWGVFSVSSGVGNSFSPFTPHSYRLTSLCVYLVKQQATSGSHLLAVNIFVSFGQII